MRTLTPASRRALRAKAHHLHPFVSIGQHGLTAAVLHEIDVNLRAHELIKIRIFGDDRNDRERLLARICADLDAAPVQHLGKTLTVWRPAPEPEAVAARPAPRPAAAKRNAKSRRAGATTNATPGARPHARPAQAKSTSRSGTPKVHARSAATPGARRRRVPR